MSVVIIEVGYFKVIRIRRIKEKFCCEHVQTFFQQKFVLKLIVQYRSLLELDKDCFKYLLSGPSIDNDEKLVLRVYG